MKILIIEDNVHNMKFVSNLLEMSGYEILRADNAESGIAIARDELPALILMDIQLPGMDGITATKILKDEEMTGNIPIIAMTSFAMKGDREKVIEAGCDTYITKPFNYKELLQIVKSFWPDS